MTIRIVVWSCLFLGVNASGTELLRAQSNSPYPPSPVIQAVDWDFAHLVRMAHTPGKGGSDLWPATWGADGNIYAGWGDGGGFRGASDGLGRVSLGFARVEGMPPQVKGVDVWGHYPKYAEHPATFCGKPEGMLSLNGVLYAWLSSWFNESAANYVHCPPNPKAAARMLAWSNDLGATWTLSPWKLDQSPLLLTWASFLNFGQDYSGARDHYVYQYWRVAGEPNLTYLVRVRGSDLQKNPGTSGAYEYYAGASSRWAPAIAHARPVLVDPGGRCITHVVYNSGLRRYIASVQGRSVGATGLFDAPEPWGPWTTIAYYHNWGHFGDRESLGMDFPAKWISRDGKTMWAVFSGGRLAKGDDVLDSFNLVKLTLILRADTVSRPPKL